MSNQNNNEDFHSISFDKIYPDTHRWYPMNDSDNLSNSNSFCDKLCLWWFFHSSHGLNTFEQNLNNKRYKFICGNCCIWCIECKFKFKCCVNEIGCCFFTLLFD